MSVTSATAPPNGSSCPTPSLSSISCSMRCLRSSNGWSYIPIECSESRADEGADLLSQFCSALVDAGMGRQEAYKLVQGHAQRALAGPALQMR